MRILVALSTSFVVAWSLLAQEKANGPQQRTGSAGSAAQKSTQSSTPRPSPAIGNEIAQVIASLNTAGAARGKGEYETTKEYESRSNEVSARFGQLAFLLPADASEFGYDADKREMRLDLLSGEVFLGEDEGDRSVGSFCLKRRLVRTGTYVGSNVFGVSRRIQSSVYAEHGIAISPDSPISIDRSTGGGTFTFPLEVPVARSLKPFLRVVLAGPIAKARVYKTKEHQSPNIDDPYEMTSNGLYILLLLEEVRVIDVRSGKQVAIIPPEGTSVDDKGSDVTGTELPCDAPQVKFTPPGEDIIPGASPPTSDGPVSASVLMFKTEPEFSEEARKAKFQGTVVLRIEVSEMGVPRLPRIERPLGLGLDEKAIEAVQKWRFKPALKDGKPVAAFTTVEVNFRLL